MKNTKIRLPAVEEVQNAIQALKLSTIDGVAPVNEKARREAAELYAEIKNQMDFIKETLLEPLGTQIKQLEPFTEFFPEDGEKVVLADGALDTEIDQAVIEDLTWTEVKKVITVGQQLLTDMGRDDLVTKYKKVLGKKAPKLEVKDLAAADKKLLEKNPSLTFLMGEIKVING
jgi:hypothetical protein